MAKLSDEQIVAAWKAPYERKNEDSWFVEFARAIESAARREAFKEAIWHITETAHQREYREEPRDLDYLNGVAIGIKASANCILALDEEEAQ